MTVLVLLAEKNLLSTNTVNTCSQWSRSFVLIGDRRGTTNIELRGRGTARGLSGGAIAFTDPPSVSANGPSPHKL